jgi:uncharacterized protein (TIGR02757 family)
MRDMRTEELRRRLDELYRHYDHRFVTPDPLEFVRAQAEPRDREVVGLLASSLAFGTVGQIKKSIAVVLGALGSGPADAVTRLDPRQLSARLAGFRHRWSDGRDVACLLFFARQMIEARGSIEGFFAEGVDPGAPDISGALRSFAERALALDHGGLYRERRLPADAGVRYFFPSPADGSACKRLNLFLRWMVRRDAVDLGVWSVIPARSLVIPLDAHIFTIARRVRLTRYKSAGWAMASDITKRLRRLDPEDPVKYDFALHRMGLFKKHDEIGSLRSSSRAATDVGGTKVKA